MKMKLLAVVATVATIATASPSIAADVPKKIQDQVSKKIGENLKDPYSAQYTFDYNTLSKGKGGKLSGMICGTVNAKNSYGGYAGPKQYSAFVTDDIVDSGILNPMDSIDMCGIMRRQHSGQ